MPVPGFGPFNFIPRAQTGVYRSFCSMVDNGSTAPGFPTTVTWDIDGVVASALAPQFSPMAFNTQGTGTFSLTSWAAGPFPQGNDGYILIDEQISGNYTAGNWTVSIGVIAATATCDGAGNPVVRIYASPNQGGQTSLNNDNWKEITTVPLALSGWSNLTTTTIQDCVGTFNPGALDFNGQTLCARVEMELTATTTNVGAQVTIVNDPAHSFLRPPAASFTTKPVGRTATVAKAAGFTWPFYPVTLHGPFQPGDVWYFGILRVQATPPPVGNDVLAVTEPNSITIVQNTKDSFSDSDANLTDIWSGTINASVSDITIQAQLDVQDVGAIVEIMAAVYRNYTGAGKIIVDASFNHGNAIGSPEQTFQGSFTLTGAPAIIYQYATGQAGNWAPDPTATPPDTSYLIDQCAANTDQYENYSQNPGLYHLAYAQGHPTGTGLHFLSLFVSVPISGTAAQTLSEFSQQASGVIAITGAAAQTLQGLTQQATGTVGGTISGTAAQTLHGFNQQATGTVGTVITGVAAQTLHGFTQQATGGPITTLTQVVLSWTVDVTGSVLTPAQAALAMSQANLPLYVDAATDPVLGQLFGLTVDSDVSAADSPTTATRTLTLSMTTPPAFPCRPDTATPPTLPLTLRKTVPLPGSFFVANGLTSVPTTVSQVPSLVAAVDKVQFAVQGGVFYNVAVVAGGSITLGSPFVAKTSNTSAVKQVPSPATTLAVYSTSPLDTAGVATVPEVSAGSGARSVTLVYLDSTGAGPFTVTVDLTGKRPAALALAVGSKDVAIINSFRVASVGAFGNSVGQITLVETSAPVPPVPTGATLQSFLGKFTDQAQLLIDRPLVYIPPSFFALAQQGQSAPPLQGDFIVTTGSKVVPTTVDQTAVIERGSVIQFAVQDTVDAPFGAVPVFYTVDQVTPKLVTLETAFTGLGTSLNQVPMGGTKGNRSTELLNYPTGAMVVTPSNAAPPTAAQLAGAIGQCVAPEVAAPPLNPPLQPATIPTPTLLSGLFTQTIRLALAVSVTPKPITFI